MANKLAVFDLDGVLIDSREANFQAFAAGLRAADCPVPSQETVTCLIGLCAKEMLLRLGCPDASVAHIYDQVVKPFYLENLGRLARPVDQARAVLEGLRARGYRLAACTSGDSATQETALRCIGLRDYFEEMQTPDTSPHRKPHVEFLGELVRRFPASDVLLHIEDAQVGLQMGLDYGATTVFADYGFGQPGSLVPHHRISRLASLLEWVDSGAVEPRLARSA